MFTFLTILILISCCLLVLAVVIQNSKGGGLASNIGGAQVASQILGARRAADFVEKGTWWLLGILVLLTFIANFVVTPAQDENNGNRFKSAVQSGSTNNAAPAPAQTQPAPAQTQPAAPAPATAP